MITVNGRGVSYLIYTNDLAFRFYYGGSILWIEKPAFSDKFEKAFDLDQRDMMYDEPGTWDYICFNHKANVSNLHNLIEYVLRNDIEHLWSSTSSFSGFSKDDLALFKSKYAPILLFELGE